MRHPPVVVSAGARARRCPEAGWLRLGRPPRRGRLPGRRPCRAAAGSIGSDRFRQRISLSQVAADSPLCPGGHGGGHWRKEEGMCICQLRPLPWPLLARWPTELANVAAEDRPQIAGRPRPRACGVGAGGGGHGTPGDARRSGGPTKNRQRLPSGAPPTAGANRGRDQPTESPPTRHVAPPSCGTVRIGRPSPWPTRGHRGGDCAGDGAAGGAWCVRRWECSEARTPRRVQPAAIQAPRAAPPQAAVRPLHAQLRGPVCGHLTLCPREAK